MNYVDGFLAAVPTGNRGAVKRVFDEGVAIASGYSGKKTIDIIHDQNSL